MRAESNSGLDRIRVLSRDTAALERLRLRLSLQLAQPKAVRVFDEAKARHPATLGAYATPVDAVADVLVLTAEHDDARVKFANAILRSIVIEYQASALDTWSAAIVLSCTPAMRRLAWLARPRQLEPDELIPRMVESLLVVAREHPTASHDTHLVVYLRREMTRHAFEGLERGRKNHTRTRAAIDDAFARGRMEPFANGRNAHSGHPADEAIEREQQVIAIRALGPIAFAVFDLPQPSLRALTSALRPDLPADEQRHLYQRLKRWYARCRAAGAPIDDLPPWWRGLTDTTTDERKLES